MSPGAINEWLSRRPFQPFRIKFSNRESVDVIHPEWVVVMKRDLFIAAPSRARIHLHVLMHVVELELLQAA